MSDLVLEAGKFYRWAGESYLKAWDTFCKVEKVEDGTVYAYDYLDNYLNKIGTDQAYRQFRPATKEEVILYLKKRDLGLQKSLLDLEGKVNTINAKIAEYKKILEGLK